MATELVVLGYLAEHSELAPDSLPVLIRNVRDEEGHVYEQSWRPRQERWEMSWHQDEARIGLNDNDLEQIGEREALRIQEAYRTVIARLDAEN